jgi:RNase adaptor protein for sRNA GlmZ degradation
MAKRYQTATKTTTWSRRYSRNQKSIKLLLTILKEVEKMQSMTTVTVAIASTRGRQRSPAFAYRLGELLMRKRQKVKVFHKDADREVDQYSVALS